jgi:hypothetical protein
MNGSRGSDEPADPGAVGEGAGQPDAEETPGGSPVISAVLGDLTAQLAAPSPDTSLPAFLTDKLLALTQGLAAGFSLYDPEHRALVTVYVDIPHFGAKTRSAVRRRLCGTRSPVSSRMYRTMVGEMVGVRPTLTAASFGAIPPIVSRGIARTFGIDRYIGVAYVVDGELLGTSILALGKHTPDPQFELLRSFAEAGGGMLRERSAEHERLMSEVRSPESAAGDDFDF